MNKSIIFLPAHRYNLGRCSVKEWKKLDEDILKLSESSGSVGSLVTGFSILSVLTGSFDAFLVNVIMVLFMLFFLK